MKIKAFKAVFPKVDLITSPSSFFSNIKYTYSEYRKSGFYTPQEKEGIYVYQIKTRKRKHTGFICCTDVDDLRNKKIRPHESTLAAKEQAMMHLFMQRHALVKPVLLGYRPTNGIEKVLKTAIHDRKPIVKVVFSSEEHMLWSITDNETISSIITQAQKIKRSYICDGHHRSSTVLLLNSSKDLGEDSKKYDELLTAYFPFNELEISDYNRIVNISSIMPASRFMAKLSKYFRIKRIKKGRKPEKKHEVSFYIEGYWYRMRWKKTYLEQNIKSPVLLDSALINHYIFEKILKIKNIRTNTRITYFSGEEPISKIERHADDRKCGIGICIYPVAVSELTTTADNGFTLPPKSTWFVPRLKSGIVAKDL
ncbi:MAG: DUF1015 domain-containing protein [Saprospiraceae bacterium]|nr:DUF1015 family protein [Bacteroidia bacterium]NNF20625.1 DUF1015 domain-containing protein [Saprospiraceae bacterium]NNK89965.1 DUF1015 domain-containing protein [Saprospiraceae bacterium]